MRQKQYDCFVLQATFWELARIQLKIAFPPAYTEPDAGSHGERALCFRLPQDPAVDANVGNTLLPVDALERDIKHVSKFALN